MISVVYWENELPARYRLGLNLATLLGSMLGQVTLGYLADRLGRKKVHGLELTFYYHGISGYGHKFSWGVQFNVTYRSLDLVEGRDGYWRWI